MERNGISVYAERKRVQALATRERVLPFQGSPRIVTVERPRGSSDSAQVVCGPSSEDGDDDIIISFNTV